MPTREHADRLVASYLAKLERDRDAFGAALPEFKDRPRPRLQVTSVTEYDFGWVYRYGAQAAMETGAPLARLAGDAPLIVDRHDGGLYVTGTARPIEDYLDQYRSVIRTRVYVEDLPFAGSWRRAWLGCGARGAGEDVHAALAARYAEPHRAYHTLQHLGECLEHFAAARDLAEHPAEVEAALWFHDAVYDVRASDNEERSASWAAAALTAAGAPAASAALVRSLVLATRHQALPLGRDERLVVDVDLAILAAEPSRFAEYEAQIRREYEFVPDFVFMSKRRAVLRSFLERPAIYGTSYFRERWENTARANLRRAIGEPSGSDPL